MKPQVKLWPSEVRKAVLAEHSHIRAALAQIEKLARRAVDGESAVTADLRDQVASFLRYFENHLRYEERMLVPVLADDFAWGKERVENLLADHFEQRARLDAIAGQAGDPHFPPRALGEIIHSLVIDLLEDMTGEEHDLLTENVLRDGPDTPDQNSG